MAQPKKYQSLADKQRAYRERKRNAPVHDKALRLSVAQGQVVLSLFPGADLLGRAFQQLGFCVVSAGDKLLGHDVREFHATRGRFDGIIGGPPCQAFSKAAITGTDAQNLIPEFVRIVEEASPRWAVMENVREAHPYAPRWPHVNLRDWDCGGHTHRQRGFWFYGMQPPPKPPTRAGTPAYSVLASNWNHRGPTTHARNPQLDAAQAAHLQGFPELESRLIDALPGWLRADGRWSGVSSAGRQAFAVHTLGNGVPKAMGLYVAEAVLTHLVMQQLKWGA